MTRKSESLYVALLTYIVDAAAKMHIALLPPVVSVDFELAAVNAIRRVFPTAEVSCCYFHLCQSVWRHTQSLGLTCLYKQDAEFATRIRMLPSLAYVPTEDVVQTYELLNATVCCENSRVVFEYFERNYIGTALRRICDRQGRNHVHRNTPLFPPATWNAFSCLMSGLATTNNNVEAWHRRFQALVSVSHPSFYKCLDKLRQEQRATDSECARLHAGVKSRKWKRRSVQVRLDKLRDVVATWRPEMTVSEKMHYLRTVATTFSFHSSAQSTSTDPAASRKDTDSGSAQNFREVPMPTAIPDKKDQNCCSLPCKNVVLSCSHCLRLICITT